MKKLTRKTKKEIRDKVKNNYYMENEITKWLKVLTAKMDVVDNKISSIVDMNNRLINMMDTNNTLLDSLLNNIENKDNTINKECFACPSFGLPVLPEASPCRNCQKNKNKFGSWR